ncbi:MAG: hypothetical protein II969_05180 [Anaerolineaceae bacterium]|nr:hypothetical protein [Anaerolineaceae bacterium]
MATSSITEKIIINNSQAMIDFINAMENIPETENEEEIHSNVVRDPEILRIVFDKGRKRYNRE